MDPGNFSKHMENSKYGDFCQNFQKAFSLEPEMIWANGFVLKSNMKRQKNLIFNPF